MLPLLATVLFSNRCGDPATGLDSVTPPVLRTNVEFAMSQPPMNVLPAVAPMNVTRRSVASLYE